MKSRTIDKLCYVYNYKARSTVAMNIDTVLKEEHAVTSLAAVTGAFLFAIAVLAVVHEIKYQEQVAKAAIVKPMVIPPVILAVEPVSPIDIDPKEMECLAANIYHEARGESTEGQVAVGVITLNRVSDKRWPNTVCDVVEQKALIVKKDEVGSVVSEKYICQFGWNCDENSQISFNSGSWRRSKTIANELLSTGDYQGLAPKYESALYFHNAADSPKWRHTKTLIEKTGAHFFYTDG